MNEGPLCIVSCGKAKVWDREPTRGGVAARDVYIGSFASAARAYAECFYTSWVILSAKHGLLLPSDIVPGPYEVSFAKKRDPNLISSERLRAQAHAKELDQFSEVVIVAGKNYVEPIRAAFGMNVRIVTPLEKLTSMGAMIGALRRATATCEPLAG